MRLQLALNVKNLDRAIQFYSKMFATPIHKQRTGYANFEIDQPPLKLVLFEHPDATENLNHIGVECVSQAEFDAASNHLHSSDLVTSNVGETGCCHARQAKFWVSGDDALNWEWYRILDDESDEPAAGPSPSDATCCGQDAHRASEPDHVCCA